MVVSHFAEGVRTRTARSSTTARMRRTTNISSWLGSSPRSCPLVRATRTDYRCDRRTVRCAPKRKANRTSTGRSSTTMSTRASAPRRHTSGGGPLQFPPPLSERSEPLTPGSPSRLHFQDLHRFHGLRPSPPGSTLPRPTRHRAGDLTTRQASLDVTDRSVAHPADRDARRWASTPPVSRRHRQPATGPPDSYPDRTCTGKRRRAYESAVNQSLT